MTESNQDLRSAIQRLHAYILTAHWTGEAISGPDSGVRFEFRLWRFIKSYLPFLPWQDHYIFMQAQGYWIRSNWLLADLQKEERYGNLARLGADYLVLTQQPEGYWNYPPVPTRKGKIATVEGNIASIGLLESYRRTGQETYLAAACRWADFLQQGIGFQAQNGSLAINYWAGAADGPVPNNTTLTLWTLAELADATHDKHYLASCTGMVAFLQQVQMKSGELPYIAGVPPHTGRPHFLCYQYNAFEFLDLIHYYRLTGDETVLPILTKLAHFLATGITDAGTARYSCLQQTPVVPYYTTAVAAALQQAATIGLHEFQALAEQVYRRSLQWQRDDGGIAYFSTKNYGFLTDRRSYPRNLVMILYHWLLAVQTQNERGISPLTQQIDAKNPTPETTSVLL